MIPRIIQFELGNDWKLWVTFDDGFRVCYDVKDDIETIEDFKSLITEIGLWPMAQWMQAVPASLGTNALTYQATPSMNMACRSTKYKTIKTEL